MATSGSEAGRQRAPAIVPAPPVVKHVSHSSVFRLAATHGQTGIDVNRRKVRQATRDEKASLGNHLAEYLRRTFNDPPAN